MGKHLGHLGGIWEASRRFSPLAKEFSRLILELVFVDFYQCWMAVGLYFGTFGLTFGTLERSLGPPGRLLGPRPLKTSKNIFFWDLILDYFLGHNLTLLGYVFEVRLPKASGSLFQRFWTHFGINFEGISSPFCRCWKP